MTYEVRVTKTTYDAVAADFAQKTAEPWAFILERMKAFIGHLTNDHPVLDLGSGPGRDSLLLAQRGLRVVSIDIAAGMLAAGNLAAAVQADMQSIPTRGSSFAGVWCQAALLHVPRRDVPCVLDEVRRVVVPSGLLHLCTAEGVGEGWEPYPGIPERKRWFVNHKEEGLVQELEARGFLVLEVTRSFAGRRWLSLLAQKD